VNGIRSDGIFSDSDTSRPQVRVRDLAEVDGVAGARSILTQWMTIGLAAAVALGFGAWWSYLLAIVVIATRQHALLVLMHDGAHRLLTRHNFVNDLVSDLFLAFPLFVSTSLYRSHHFRHHRFLNSDADPDVADSREAHSKAGWMLIFLSDAGGRSFWKLFRSGSDFSMLNYLTGGAEIRRLVPVWQFVAFVVMWVGLGAVLTVVHGWSAFLLLWIVPMFTVLGLILHVRAVAEHAGCDPVPTIAGTRTVIPGTVERLLFAPVNVNYHLAHHLFPGVPATKLARLHARLCEDASFRRSARVTKGYFLGETSVLAEVAHHGADSGDC
jgi:fatty acid desaturase